MFLPSETHLDEGFRYDFRVKFVCIAGYLLLCSFSLLKGLGFVDRGSVVFS